MQKLKRFTPSENKAIERYLDQGMSISKIAVILKRSYSATFTRATVIREARAKNQDVSPKRLRGCLKCHDNFMSEHAGNRICPRCKVLNDGLVQSICPNDMMPV